MEEALVAVALVGLVLLAALVVWMHRERRYHRNGHRLFEELEKWRREHR